MDTLPPIHPPGRSRTQSAWNALLVLLFLFLLFFFHSFLLRMSVRSALWLLQPITGVTIKTEKIDVIWGKPIHAHHVTINAGQAPFATQLTFRDCSLELSSWWRLFFGDHLLINSLDATNGKGIIDLRTQPTHVGSFWKKGFSSLLSSSSESLNLLPASLRLHNISFLLLSEEERYTVDQLSCTLPNKITGQLSYQSILVEAGKVHCQIKDGKAKALWDGKKLSLYQLRLGEDIMLKNLNLVPHRDRIDLGMLTEIFTGLLRVDGSLRHTPQGTFIDSALLGQQLPLGRISHFLGLQKNLAGTAREARLTFRGFMLHPIDAEISLRMLADNVHFEKRGWASLGIVAHLIGRKICLTDFQLKQHDNRVAASGEITLPEEWHKIAQSPFTLKLKANISDASQLADLMGSSWSILTGKLFADGEVRGAANRAEGYLNIEGTSMTAYELPLNSLKLQLLFQGEKTNLMNFDLWSGSDHLECSGIFENRWPHRYEGKATLQSHDLSEKLIPFFKEHFSEISPLLNQNYELFEKFKLQGGALQAAWKGDGEATEHKGSFQLSLHDLTQDLHKMSAHAEGSYGPAWLSLSSFGLEKDLKKWTGQLALSPRGIDLKNFSLLEDSITTLSGNLFLPLNATLLAHQPFSLSQSFLQDVPFSMHLKAHHLALEHETNSFPWSLFPKFYDGSLDASGLLEKPSLHFSLIGKEIKNEKGIPTMKLNLSSENGSGAIDFSLYSSKNKTVALQGKLPVGLVLQKESEPLQAQEHWQLAPSQEPLDLKATISGLNLDTAAAHFLPDFFHVQKSFLSGNLTCKGTLGQPEPSGELAFEAGTIDMKENITPLHHLQGRFLFSKEKMDLNSASASMGREKLTITGSTEWHHGKQSYHFSGTDLPFYQSDAISALGDLSLSLEGENHQITLRGKVTPQKVTGTPQLFITPFFTSPAFNIEQPSLITSASTTSSLIDVDVITPLEKTSTTSSLDPFGTINLHLAGSLLSPNIDGSIALKNIPIIFPNLTMSLQEGACYFEKSHSWHPTYSLTASGILEGKKITATLLKNQVLELQSYPFVSPSILALELALSHNSSEADQELWLSNLFYWVRETSLIEPTTIFRSPSFHDNEASQNEFWFTGSNLFYRAEMK